MDATQHPHCPGKGPRSGCASSSPAAPPRLHLTPRARQKTKSGRGKTSDGAALPPIASPPLLSPPRHQAHHRLLCSATRRSLDSRPLLLLQQPACGEMALQAPSSLLRAPAPPLRSSFSAPCSLRLPAPARRRVATAATAARITMRVASKQAYICRDCGYIYNDRTPFDKLADNYFCPVCGAPKRRFRPYEPAVAKNANSTDVRKARKEQLKKKESLGQALPIAIVAGIIALAGLYFYLNNVYS